MLRDGAAPGRFDSAFVRPARHAARCGLGVLALLGCTSCVSYDRPLPRDAARFTQLVEQWVPAGTPLATARATMEEHDFSCRVLRDAEPITYSPEPSPRIDALRCEREGGVFVSQRWYVDLLLDADDRVRAVDGSYSMASLWFP